MPSSLRPSFSYTLGSSHSDGPSTQAGTSSLSEVLIGHEPPKAESAGCPKKKGKREVLGRICWCVVCYDCLLMFNVFSLLLMFYVMCGGFWGLWGSNFSGAHGFKMRWMIVVAVVFYF